MLNIDNMNLWDTIQPGFKCTLGTTTWLLGIVSGLGGAKNYSRTKNRVLCEDYKERWVFSKTSKWLIYKSSAIKDANWQLSALLKVWSPSSQLLPPSPLVPNSQFNPPVNWYPPFYQIFSINKFPLNIFHQIFFTNNFPPNISTKMFPWKIVHQDQIFAQFTSLLVCSV